MENMTYEEWLREVDENVLSIAFVSVHELADQPLRDWYEDGMTPDEAAEEALINEDFPF